MEWLDLSPGKTLLDVACGAGGPALRIAAATGCSVVGIYMQAVTTASSLAAQRALAERAEFRSIDATGPLPFPDANFDAITCIDAINHFPDRPRVIVQCGPRLLVSEDVTGNMSKVAEARLAARGSRSTALRKIEGDQAYDRQPAVAAGVARGGRLSRFVYVSKKLT